jgi:hypothetical protein
MEETVFQQRTDLTKLNEAVNAIRDTIGKVIVGQHKMVDLMIAGPFIRWSYFDRRGAGCCKNIKCESCLQRSLM